MEKKRSPFVATKIDEAEGIVESVVSVFGVIDEGNDRIWPGAFTKTIAEQGHKVRVLDQHRRDSTLAAVGKVLELREIARDQLPVAIRRRYPEASGGLWARTKFLMDTEEGRGCFIRLKEGAVDEWSFGYDALDVDYDEVTSDGVRKTVRNLRTIRLYEYSPVLWGMNPATATVSAKETAEQKPWDVFVEGDEYCVYRVDDDGERVGDALGCHVTEEEAEAQMRALYASESSAKQDGPFTCECLSCGFVFESDEHCSDVPCPECGGECRRAERPGEGKGASGSPTLPLASRDRAWDADAAEGRVRTWAEAEDGPNARYRQAFFWYDSENAGNFTAYKLQFADVVDGELTAVPRGVFAVAGVLQGARGGVDIPEGDQAAIRTRVARYYARMRSEFDDEDLVAPWEQEESARRMGRQLKDLLERAAAIVSAAKVVSLDRRLQRIRSTFHELYPDSWPDEDGNGVRHVWVVRDVFDEHLIVTEEIGDEWHLWQVPYEASDEDVTIGPRDEWIEGEMVFVPLGERDASSSAPATAQAASDSQPDEKAGPGSTEEIPPTSERLEEIKRHLLEIDLKEVSDGLQRDAGEGPTAVPGGEGDPGG
jgi:HK97 family phage prohead protease